MAKKPPVLINQQEFPGAPLGGRNPLPNRGGSEITGLPTAQPRPIPQPPPRMPMPRPNPMNAMRQGAPAPMQPQLRPTPGKPMMPPNVPPIGQNKIAPMKQRPQKRNSRHQVKLNRKHFT